MNVSEELKQELSNAIAAYGKILRSAFIGASVPEGFEKLHNCSEEERRTKT